MKKSVTPVIRAALTHKPTTSASKPVSANGTSSSRSTSTSDKAASAAIEKYEDLFPRPVIADSFTFGFHYQSCENCRSSIDTLLCTYCPCRYHTKCLPVQEEEEERVAANETADQSKWVCPQCV